MFWMPTKIQPTLVPCEDLQGEKIKCRKENARALQKQGENLESLKLVRLK